jgi:hypothetical protein
MHNTKRIADEEMHRERSEEGAQSPASQNTKSQLFYAVRRTKAVLNRLLIKLVIFCLEIHALNVSLYLLILTT